MMKKRKRNQITRIFTLMEMVVVIVIIALLAAIATPMYMKYLRNAKKNTTLAQIKILEDAVLSVKIDTGKLPSSLDELIKNSSGSKKWDGPYLNGNLPKDAWGNEFVLNVPGSNNREYEIISYGSDAQAGGEGDAADLSSWNED
jgi:general secretion pathway protein G